MRKLLTGLSFSLLLLATHLSYADNPRVLIETSNGTMIIELYPDKAPKTVENFLFYAKSGFYEGTIFHRVISNFMIQGGGFNENMKKLPTQAPIRNEADNGLRNKIGTIAMARTNDPHSATSQFFINVANNDFLDFREKTDRAWGYTVFGRVVEGMKAVNVIRNVPTTTRMGQQDVPINPVVINKVRIVK